MPTNVTQGGPMAVASRCLLLARDLTDTAARLRAAAAELLEASAGLQIGTAIVSPAARAQVAAVDLGGAYSGTHNVKGTLGISSERLPQRSTVRMSSIQRSIDDANDELRAVQRYGACVVSSSKPRARRR